MGDSHHSIETGASKKHKRTVNEKNAQHNYDRTVTPCAVSGCRAHVGDNIAEECNRTMRFFGLPPSYEAATAWIYACKQKRAFRSLVNFIVCEQHFVDGRPTSLNPNPTLRIPSLAQSQS
ncbi:unnamed protein product [Anisakis simplex]|uniref:THAP-type domain-containing protein n=1 Tax=Anisakis simplex TaxID=6269 RepID=A0A3P6NHZ4_ANISI|nr:unnamed protein product [Anisakis simplex]